MVWWPATNEMPSRVQQHFHRQGSGLRNELTDYDESLLLDRSIVHTPAEGWAAVVYLAVRYSKDLPICCHAGV